MKPTDLRHYGQAPAPMPHGLKRVCQVLIAVAVVGAAYGLVADEPSRKVVLTPAEYSAAITAARIQAARETMEKLGTCGWRDLFLETKRGKGAM